MALYLRAISVLTRGSGKPKITFTLSSGPVAHTHVTAFRRLVGVRRGNGLVKPGGTFRTVLYLTGDPCGATNKSKNMKGVKGIKGIKGVKGIKGIWG